MLLVSAKPQPTFLVRQNFMGNAQRLDGSGHYPA
jgi:hypothetical protein